jgi:peptidoglycan-N-acetylglucosamine deacetylase
MKFWLKTNRWIRLLFPKYIWRIPVVDNIVYLTFDDGPTPEVTHWVLNQLEAYNAKATFFCIGNNIQNNREIFESILNQGHAIGNHTYNHLNGWQNTTSSYLENTLKCETVIQKYSTQKTKLFRPPYGKIKRAQAKRLLQLGYKIIMWDVLSYDFDKNTSTEECLNNVVHSIEPGSIIVFHDSLKAWERLEYVLPKTLKYLKDNQFHCKALL